MKLNMYVPLMIALLVTGILYSVGVIEPVSNRGTGWHGILFLFCILIGVVLLNYILSVFSVKDDIKKYIWNISHIITYACAVILAPNEWAYWLLLGVAWEYTECFLLNGYKFPAPFNFVKIKCNGYSDIIANIAGIAIGIAIIK
jgi:hypothetical protein